jgi:hypothetical protein
MLAVVLASIGLVVCAVISALAVLGRARRRRPRSENETALETAKQASRRASRALRSLRESRTDAFDPKLETPGSDVIGGAGLL